MQLQLTFLCNCHSTKNPRIRGYRTDTGFLDTHYSVVRIFPLPHTWSNSSRGSCISPYKILSIFYCNKGGRGENILRNMRVLVPPNLYIHTYIHVGNKGGLGGGYCTIMCNNGPSLCRERIFFQTPRPVRNPTPKKQKNTSKHLKTTSKLGGACNIW